MLTGGRLRACQQQGAMRRVGPLPLTLCPYGFWAVVANLAESPEFAGGCPGAPSPDLRKSPAWE
jgi:hypothetical protein